ncbi:hypothetical protein GLAREA_08065 [Glarea lozoyensis ATCC 20868]|uniref:Arrestin-like N-terminal domain-containing protein n=1 Tax=Glarea lozoyensis (strain ATCC 20868 / MF5171) TaxID=1116229 RepID=S3CDW9_GLAL2|nr:uncharacterized protein GLAREA_08065 [Glarea lozoyensis ATCC 20868]EPE24215.1 hypothetical protein GLAREA_08065 [Glarea lozoyensis ATCC 20868]
MSSYAASITSNANSLAGYTKKVARPARPDIEIDLKDHTEGRVYTTYDALSGNVKITAPQNARFDEVKITLEGTIRTYVDNLSPAASASTKTTAIHRFLKLVMPVSESEYPQPRIAESGRTYTFPYNFVIPDRLLPRSCTHPNTADHVTEAHLQLPPSMGHRALIGGQSDMAPEMSKVLYAIRVQVVKRREEDAREVVLVERNMPIRVIPAQAEAAPLIVGAEDDQFVLSKTKALKKGMFSGKLGKVTVSAAQPAAIILPAPSSSSSTPATTMATVQLRFDPHDSSAQPPRLGGLSTKITASTFFAVRPTSGIPTHRNAQSAFEIHRGVYDSTVSVSSRCVESVQWTKHPATIRRGSASSTSSSDFSDCSQPIVPKESAAYYSAKILVPITLPSTKVWIPTFHNCITSRLYVLDLSLSIHTPGAGVPASTVALHLPLQIGAAGNLSSRPEMTAAEAAAELAEVDEFLRPRLIEMPREELIGNSVLAHHATDLPPSYEFSGVAQAIRS